jgi:hypothetical protein
MMKGANAQKLHEKLFDDHEVLGLRGKQKMAIIVRI